MRSVQLLAQQLDPAYWTMIHHDIHHGAEIGALRDLHRLTRGAVGSGAVNT